MKTYRIYYLLNLIKNELNEFNNSLFACKLRVIRRPQQNLQLGVIFVPIEKDLKIQTLFYFNIILFAFVNII